MNKRLRPLSAMSSRRIIEFPLRTQKKGLHLSALATGPHHIRAQPFTHQEVQGLENKAFPCPRLAGQDFSCRPRAQASMSGNKAPMVWRVAAGFSRPEAF